MTCCATPKICAWDDWFWLLWCRRKVLPFPSFQLKMMHNNSTSESNWMILFTIGCAFGTMPRAQWHFKNDHRRKQNHIIDEILLLLFAFNFSMLLFLVNETYSVITRIHKSTLYINLWFCNPKYFCFRFEPLCLFAWIAEIKLV